VTGGGSAAGSSEQEPVKERPDQVRVFGRLVEQVVIEPGRESFEVFVAFGQHTGLHHHLSDVVHVSVGRKFVQKLVAERASVHDELTEQPCIGTFLDPVNLLERTVGLRKGLGHRCELARNLAVGPGEQTANLVGEHTICASVVPVGVASPAAATAFVVDAETGAGTADSDAFFVAADQRLGSSTPTALGG
jgi:hypothetical protein